MEAGPSSPRSSSSKSIDLPSLQPLSHDHPLLSAPTFSADAFLLSRLHIPLEELRGELRSYLAVLREELVQLINDDYEEFISLGTGLRGENDRLKRLQPPLKGLGEEVAGIRDILQRHQSDVQAKLDERAALREERSLLDLLQRLFETLTRAETLLESQHDDDRFKMVQRVAGEYTQLVYLSGKARAEGCQVVDSISPRSDAIRRRLSNELSNLLLDALDNVASLKQVLKTYELIEGWEEAEEVVRHHFRAFCAEVIVSSAMQTAPLPMVPITPATPHHTINPFDKLSESSPLATLLNRVLTEVGKYQPLLQMADDLSGRFDFFASVLWPEICKAMIDQLGNTIFAAGRPDELHKYYTTTHDFISLLENLAPSAQAVVDLRSSPSYETFERRWQLPVYFQLRWKEIVTSLELSLNGPVASTGEWNMATSAAAWKGLSTCWDPDVYIPDLANRFWRLSLQICSRYGTWLQSQIKKGDDPAIEDHNLKLAASAVLDLHLFKEKVNEIELLTDNGLLDQSSIPDTIYNDKIIEILTKQCTEALKLVRSVASQLRASPSRSTEISPSYFIPSILKPLHSFYTTKPNLRAYNNAWSPRIIDSICSSYAGILAGVRKTEDLLRRHRKSKKGGFSLFGGNATPGEEGSGEEERFKRQMEVDIQALKVDAKSLGVDVEELIGWKELVEVINRPSE